MCPNQKMPDVESFIVRRGQVEEKVAQILVELKDAESDSTKQPLAQLRRHARYLEHHYQQYQNLHNSVMKTIPAERFDEQDEACLRFDELYTEACVLVETFLLAIPTTDVRHNQRRIASPKFVATASTSYACVARSPPPTQATEQPVPVPNVMEMPCTLPTVVQQPHIPYQARTTEVKTIVNPTMISSVMSTGSCPVGKLSSRSAGSLLAVDSPVMSTGSCPVGKPASRSAGSLPVVDLPVMSAGSCPVDKPSSKSVGSRQVVESSGMPTGDQSVVKTIVMPTGIKPVVKPFIIPVGIRSVATLCLMPAGIQPVVLPIPMPTASLPVVESVPKPTVKPFQKSIGTRPVAKMSNVSCPLVKPLPFSMPAGNRSMIKPFLSSMPSGSRPVVRMFTTYAGTRPVDKLFPMSAEVDPVVKPTTMLAGSHPAVKPSPVPPSNRSMFKPSPTPAGIQPVSYGIRPKLKPYPMQTDTCSCFNPFPVSSGIHAVPKPATNPSSRVRVPKPRKPTEESPDKSSSADRPPKMEDPDYSEVVSCSKPGEPPPEDLSIHHEVNEPRSTRGLVHSRPGQPREDVPVRSRVRYWLNDIVDEMRKKSPASVQKWVDSIQIPGPGGAGSSADPGPSSAELAGQHGSHTYVVESTGLTESGESGSELDRESNEDVLRVDAPVSTSDEEFLPAATPHVEHRSDAGSAMSIKSLLSKKSLLEKFSRSSTNLQEQDAHLAGEQESVGLPTEDESRKGPSLASIGKIKINEFYDRLSMNKAKYNLIKAKKIDIRNMLGASKENLGQKVHQAVESKSEETVVVKEEEDDGVDSIVVEDRSESKQQQSEASGKLSTADIYEFSFDESFPKDEDLPDVSEDEEKENLEMPTQGYDTYLNPPKTFHRIGIGKIGRSSSENPRANNKRYNLLDIGRSFSEMNDDDNFVINECNNSCPNPSSLNTSSSINNSSNNILARSVPVSPIPRTSSKMSIQQEISLSESPRRRSAMLMKESSLQSDSSRCSSVESLLNARKPDPERILLNLGFGPAPHSTDVLSKIPKRFLKPSQVRGVDTEAFLRQQQLSMHIHENSVLGYRGLVGNPHIPPSMIVAKIMERFQENERGRLVRSRTLGRRGPVELSTSAPTGDGGHLDSRSSSGPPSPIPIPRHPSLASEGRV